MTDRPCAERAQKHSPEAWEAVRDRFTQLYQDSGFKLKTIIDIMREQHGFDANERQWKGKITKWGLEKNVKTAEATFMLYKKTVREQLGKDTVFKLNGRRVDPYRLLQAEKKFRTQANSASSWSSSMLSSNFAATPANITYHTPINSRGNSTTVVKEQTVATAWSWFNFGKITADFPNSSSPFGPFEEDAIFVNDSLFSSGATDLEVFQPELGLYNIDPVNKDQTHGVSNTTFHQSENSDGDLHPGRKVHFQDDLFLGDEQLLLDESHVLPTKNVQKPEVVDHSTSLGSADANSKQSIKPQGLSSKEYSLLRQAMISCLLNALVACSTDTERKKSWQNRVQRLVDDDGFEDEVRWSWDRSGSKRQQEWAMTLNRSPADISGSIAIDRLQSTLTTVTPATKDKTMSFASSKATFEGIKHGATPMCVAPQVLHNYPLAPADYILAP